MTAKKVLGYFEKKSIMGIGQVQTDFEFVDPDKYARTQQKIAVLEGQAKELRGKIGDLESDLDVRRRVHIKLQSEVDNERANRDAVQKDLNVLREEQANLIRLYTVEKKQLQAAENDLEEKRKLIKALKKENAELKTKVEQKQYVIEWFESNHNTGYEQLKEVRKELRVLYKQYFQPKLVSAVLPNHATTRRRSISHSVNPYAEPLVKPRKSKSANLWRKREVHVTLGFALEEEPESSEGKQAAAGTGDSANPQKGSTSQTSAPAQVPGLPSTDQPIPEDLLEEGAEATGRRHRRKRGKHHRARASGEDSSEDSSDLEEDDEYERSRGMDEESVSSESEDGEKEVSRRARKGGKGKKGRGKGGRKNMEQGESEDEELEERKDGGEQAPVEKTGKGRKAHAGKAGKSTRRKESNQSEATTAKQGAPSITSSYRGRPSQGSMETDALRDSVLSSKAGPTPSESVSNAGKKKQYKGDSMPNDPSRVSQKDSYSQSSQHRSYGDADDRIPYRANLYTDSPDADDRPTSHYIPSIAAEEIYELGENDKVVMTDNDLKWVVVQVNSVGVQYNYLKPELVYEEGEDAVIGTDGVKYYMWPLNPNQLYGLSGDVFYHTVLRAFQAVPRVPLSKTGEPHHPPYELAADPLTGTHLSGESHITATKPRPVDHTATCGPNCKHLNKKPKLHTKKEALLPVATQDLKYQRVPPK